MLKTSVALVVPALFAAAILASGHAVAKPIRTTTISGQSAEAFCHGHGGGTDCVFCHRDHCHVISCSEGSGGKKYCTNTVSFRKADRGGIRPTSAGTASSGAATPPGGHRHPVKIIGFKPPSEVKTTGGGGKPVTIMHADEHHGDKHK
jgi:hypothetical protein